MIESMNGGAFLNLMGDLAYKSLDKLADNSQQWDFTSCHDKSTRNPKKGGIHKLRGEIELNLKMDTIVKRLDTLNMGQPVNAANTFSVDSCSVCASPMHQAQNCLSFPVFSENQMEQANAFNDFKKQSSGPYSESYNLGWRIHPNFSWRQNQPTNQRGAPHAQNQYPSGFPLTYQNQGHSTQPASSSYQAPTQAPASLTQSLEDTMREFMKMTGQSINDMRNSTMVNTQAISKLDM